MKILGVDPGPERSGYSIWDSELNRVVESGEEDNAIIKSCITECDYTVIEMMRNYGMVVGKSVFNTLVWIGVFCQTALMSAKAFNLVERPVVLNYFCGGTDGTKKGSIPVVLMDKYGKKGTKKKHGPFFGVSGTHAWDATGLAIWVAEQAGKVPQHPLANMIYGNQEVADEWI